MIAAKAICADIMAHQEDFNMQYWDKCIAAAILRVAGAKLNTDGGLMESSVVGNRTYNIGDRKIPTIARHLLIEDGRLNRGALDDPYAYHEEWQPLFHNSEWSDYYQSLAEREDPGYGERCPLTACKVVKSWFREHKRG